MHTTYALYTHTTRTHACTSIHTLMEKIGRPVPPVLNVHACMYPSELGTNPRCYLEKKTR